MMVNGIKYIIMNLQKSCFCVVQPLVCRLKRSSEVITFNMLNKLTRDCLFNYFRDESQTDTSWKFLKTSWSRFDFLRRGRICAIFSISGMMAQSKEQFTILVITGTTVGQHFFNMVAGIGSQSQLLTVDELINLDTWSSVAGNTKIHTCKSPHLRGDTG